MLIDTHCHLNSEEYSEDRNTVISNAKKAGVKKFIVPGYGYTSSHLTIELAASRPKEIFAAIGTDPYEAARNPDISWIEPLLSNPSIIAIGECGLDYHQYKGFDAIGKKDEQKWLFEAQITIAIQYHLPVIIHCRDAFSDLWPFLDSLSVMPKGVIHCFSGTVEDLAAAKKRNLYVGFDGNITYGKQFPPLIELADLSMILLETDSPYLTPVPHRGERNEPKYLRLVADKIAQTKLITTDDVIRQTAKNASSLFGIML
jgi:TatD DNase family protein